MRKLCTGGPLTSCSFLTPGFHLAAQRLYHQLADDFGRILNRQGHQGHPSQAKGFRPRRSSRPRVRRSHRLHLDSQGCELRVIRPGCNRKRSATNSSRMNVRSRRRRSKHTSSHYALIPLPTGIPMRCCQLCSVMGRFCFPTVTDGKPWKCVASSPLHQQSPLLTASCPAVSSKPVLVPHIGQWADSRTMSIVQSPF